jgi:organic hydroperoxide reductase OsmC/OhrA
MDHSFEAAREWTGARRGPTQSYEGYARDFTITAPGHPPLPGNAPPAFHGDGSGYNPEELLLAALMACHMLTYLGRCARSGVLVVGYSDRGAATLGARDGRTQVVDVLLRPRVTVAKGQDVAKALAFHEAAARACFIANSVNFPVRHEPEVVEGMVLGSTRL